MTLPNFICIGAQKAGTTWLYDMLAQNPSIWLPPLKEVHFFDNLDAGPREKARRSEHIAKLARKDFNGKRKRGSDGIDKAAFLNGLVGDHVLSDDWYRSIFDHPDAKGRICGEITPAYLTIGEQAIQKVKSMLPDTKIILIVREPHARNLSQIKMAVARAKADPQAEEDWAPFVKKMLTNTRGDYASAIPLWQKYFGPDQLLIVPFSQIRNEPAGLLGRIETFIGAARFEGYAALNEVVHKTKEVKVPDWVSRKAGELAEPQREFLIEAFGQEFYDNTR